MWSASEGGRIPTRVLDNFTISSLPSGDLLQLLDLPYSCAPDTAEVRGLVGGPRGTGQAIVGRLAGWGIHTSVGFNAAPPQPWVLVGGTVWPLGQCAPAYLELYMPCIGLASVLNAVVQVISSNAPDPYYRVQQLLSAKSMDKQLLVAWSGHIRHHLAPMTSLSPAAQLFLQQMEFSLPPPVHQTPTTSPTLSAASPHEAWRRPNAPPSPGHLASNRLGTWTPSRGQSSSRARPVSPSMHSTVPPMLPAPPRMIHSQPPLPPAQRQSPTPVLPSSPRPHGQPARLNIALPSTRTQPSPSASSLSAPSTGKRSGPSNELSVKRQRTNRSPAPKPLPLSSLTGVIEAIRPYEGPSPVPPFRPAGPSIRRVLANPPPLQPRPDSRVALPRPSEPSVQSTVIVQAEHTLQPLLPKPSSNPRVIASDNAPVPLVPRPSKRRYTPDEELDSGDLACLPSEPFAIEVSLGEGQDGYDVTGALLMLCQFLSAFGHLFDITPPSLRSLHKIFSFPLHELSKRPLGVLSNLHRALLQHVVGDKNFLLATLQESFSHSDAATLQPLRDAAMEDLSLCLSHRHDPENGISSEAVTQFCSGTLEEKALAITALLRALPIDNGSWTEALRLVALFCDSSLASVDEPKQFLVGEKDYFNLSASSRLRLVDLLIFLVLETDSMRQTVLEAFDELANLRREDRQASMEMREKQLDELRQTLERAAKKDGDANPLPVSRHRLLEVHNNELRRKKVLARQEAVNGELSGLAALSEYGDRRDAITAKAVLRRKAEEFSLQSSTGALLLGEDRLFRRYWLLDLPTEPTFPIGLGVAVEEPPCDGSRRQKWAFCLTAKSLGRLLRYLNRNGVREKALASQLEYWMPLINNRLSQVRSATRTFCDEARASSNTHLPLPWRQPEDLEEPMVAEECPLLLAPLLEKLSALELGLDWLVTTAACPDGKVWRREWIKRLKQSSSLAQLASLSVDLAEMLTASHALLEEWWQPVRARWLQVVGSNTVTAGRLSMLLLVLDENILLDCDEYPSCTVCGRSTAAAENMVKCLGCSGYAHTFCAGVAASIEENGHADIWNCSQCSQAPATKAKASAKKREERQRISREDATSAKESTAVRSSTRARKPTAKVSSIAADRQSVRNTRPSRNTRRPMRAASPSPPVRPSAPPSPEPEADVMDESNDACEVCDDGGNLLCCETCPRVFHLKCVGLRRQPRGDWHCPNCSNKN